MSDETREYQLGLLRGEVDAVKASVAHLHGDMNAGFARLEEVAKLSATSTASLSRRVRSLELYRTLLAGAGAAIVAIWAVGSKLLSLFVGRSS
mgnify:CR=1 FL=1